MAIIDPVESMWTDVGEALIEPPKYIVNNILPTGITFLVGPPKSYKSAVELALFLTAVGVKNNVLPEDLSVAPEENRALLLSMEASAGVIRHTIEEGFGVQVPPDRRLLVMSDPWRFRLDNPRDVRDLIEWADHLHASIIGIDPLRNCHSLDENDSGGMVEMLQPLQRWATTQDKAVIIVHHSKKISDDKNGDKRNAGAQDMRGTSALFGMADAVITVTRKGQGLLHIDSVLKRGEAWQRTIQLGLWTPEPEQAPTPQPARVARLSTLDQTQPRARPR